MNLFQTTDHHIKDEEPFFQAGKALDEWLLDFFKKQTESFCYLDSGDRFHTSKETGRVNGEVIRFFLELADIPMCKGVYIIQGNHDYKSYTGSALDCLSGLSDKIKVFYEPDMISFPEQKGLSYILPHMRIKTYPYFYGKESYGKEDFHIQLWKDRGKDWETLKPKIEFLSAHLGDETCGDLFLDADLSFIKCLKSNGHIHKTVSKSQLESASVTRRDESDKKCIMRRFNTADFSTYEEIEIPLFLNYARIAYGEDIEEYFKKNSNRKKPVTSLIVDIYGHDNEDFVREEYAEKFAAMENPRLYVGEVVSEERILKTEDAEERENLDISGADIKELFKQFCKEKSVADTVRDDILKRI